MNAFLNYPDAKIFSEFNDVDVLLNNEAFLLYGKVDGIVCGYAPSPDLAKTVVQMTPNNATLVCAKGEFLKDEFLKNGYALKKRCFQFEYYKSFLPTEENGFLIKAPHSSEEEKILSFYPSEKDYVKKLLQNGGFFCAYCGNEIIGCVGEHERGTIGLLFVKPEYRRKGVAKLLMTAKTNEVISRGKIPVLHVEQGNDASFNLQKSIGYELSPEKVFWLTPQGVL